MSEVAEKVKKIIAEHLELMIWIKLLMMQSLFT